MDAGLGMNKQELARNPVLTEYDVIDLNNTPKLPFENNSFDFITNAVSVDYLTKPLEVFRCDAVSSLSTGYVGIFAKP